MDKDWTLKRQVEELYLLVASRRPLDKMVIEQLEGIMRIIGMPKPPWPPPANPDPPVELRKPPPVTLGPQSAASKVKPGLK